MYREKNEVDSISFLPQKSNDWKYQETVNKAILNIVTNVKDIENPYAQAIAAYALQLSDHPKKDEILDDLVSKSITKGKKDSSNMRKDFYLAMPLILSSDQHKWFTKSKPGPNVRQSKSIDVEITSYGVLALIEAKQFAEALPYFRWLLAQRNDKGGFFGTQDTVIGLEALASYGRYLTVKDNAVQLKVQADSIEEKLLNVKSENALVLQTLDLPANTQSVHLTATGHGFALFQLSYRYNLNESDVYATFDLKPTILETTAGHLNVQVCARFVNDSIFSTKIRSSNLVFFDQ